MNTWRDAYESQYRNINQEKAVTDSISLLADLVKENSFLQ
jgi:hypothetical protein